jgi:metallo-beta-lactamase family protein
MNFNLEFIGAKEGVTGSKTIFSFEGKNYLVDCGLFQGPPDIRKKNWEPLGIPAEDIDAVFLTHAHLDHSGYLPRLVKQGFRGPIYCSRGSAALCEILLRDAAYLEEEQAKFANDTKYSRHRPALPLFTRDDAEAVFKQLRPCERYQWINISEQLSLEFRQAGHIVGASSLRFNLSDGHKQHLLVFSGDIGNNRSMTIRPPDPLPSCHTLIIESTYGDRLQPDTDANDLLAEKLRRTFARKGVAVIPAFAVGRAQEVLVRIGYLERSGMIPQVPVVLDSPMAIMANQVFLEHSDDHRQDLNASRQNLFPRHFEVTRSADESMLQCMKDGPMVVISAAGMLSGGRILHHLKRRLPDERNSVIFTGYQAEGTKGRYLQDLKGDDKTLRIHHEEVPVEAEILTIDSLSSHADQRDLLAWIKSAPQLPQKIICNHGNTIAQSTLAELIESKLGIASIAAANY